MSPIGDPFDDGEFCRRHDRDYGADNAGPGQATPAPARANCRPITARREGPPRR